MERRKGRVDVSFRGEGDLETGERLVDEGNFSAK